MIILELSKQQVQILYHQFLYISDTVNLLDYDPFIDYVEEISNGIFHLNLFYNGPTLLKFQKESDKNLFILRYL